MRKIYVCLTLFCIALSTGVVCAKQTTPIQSFIDREKQQHDFTAVAGLLQGDDAFPLAETEKYVSNAQLFTLNGRTLNTIMSEKTQGIILSVPKKDGGYYEVELARFDFFSPGFKAMTKSYNVSTEYNYTPGIYYRGVVKDVPGSIAAFSFFNNEIYGIFSLPDAGNFMIVPNTLMSKTKTGHYIMYNDMDLKTKPVGGCGTDQLPNVNDMKTSANKNAYNTCKNIEVFIKADYDTYVDYGGNPTDFFNYITSVYNMVATMYRNEGIYTTIKNAEINTSFDNYQFLSKDSHDYLYAFGDDVQNNIYGANLAIMVSTTSGNMGGVAWLNGLCASYSGSGSWGPYAFCNIYGDYPGGTTLPVFSWDIDVITHEMGHNLGSPHTHNCGWPGGAIDGCAPLEGSCSMPVPQYPSGGGTIMSYCHLVSGVGINLTKGFGPLPGNKIRDGVYNSTCPVIYAPGAAVTQMNKNILATRECTDDNGITYYWNDNNNMDPADDRILLKIKKNGNDIGDLDQSGFTVRSVTYSYGSGKGIALNFPGGMQSVEPMNVGINRFWKMTTTKQPASAVEVMFPLTKTDIADVNGSIGKNPGVTNFRFYQTLNNIDPNPNAGFANAKITDFNIYTHGSSSTTTQWTETSVADTLFAHANLTSLTGGSLFYSYAFPNGVQDVNAQTALHFYPNPTKDNWTVWMPEHQAPVMLHIYAVDGRVISGQVLNAGKNDVNASSLPAGLYYYRVTGDHLNYTGALQKQ